MLAAATLVCTGEGQDAPETKVIEGELPRLTGRATVKLAQCFKGTAPQENIQVLSDEYLPAGGLSGFQGFLLLNPGEYDLFFLKPRDGNYTAVDEHYGVFPVSRAVKSSMMGKDPFVNLEAGLAGGLTTLIERTCYRASACSVRWDICILNES